MHNPRLVTHGFINLDLFAGLSSSMSSTCARVVDNLRADVGKGLLVINTVHNHLKLAVENYPKNTPTSTQLHLFLCTAFQHILHTFSSVSESLVHIIHIAYKESENLKKVIN